MNKDELLRLISELFNDGDEIISVTGKTYHYKGLGRYEGHYAELTGERVVLFDTHTTINIANLFPEILTLLVSKRLSGGLTNTVSFRSDLEGVAWIEEKTVFPDLNTHESYYMTMVNAIVKRIHLNDISTAEEVLNPSIFVEGATKTISVNAFERNLKARSECIAHYGYSCFVCGFNFKEVYGDIGDKFIHVHHETPLAEIGQEYCVDPIEDLKPLCPNCHAIIHKYKPAIEVEDLKKLLNSSI